MQPVDMAMHDNFRSNVRKRRMELRLTQKELGDLLGVTSAYVSEVEAGKRVPSLDTVERFAKALDCPPLNLLTTSEPAIAT
jgi:transcriptional regulator with XRE-family HTH domain